VSEGACGVEWSRVHNWVGASKQVSLGRWGEQASGVSK